MTEPDIFVAVDYALAQTGKPYHAYGDRFGPDYYDCSGLIVASLQHAGINVPGDATNTVGLYRWAQRVGGLVSVAEGVKTRGAIMIKGKNYGYGPLGHASFSLGDGNEMAAHGRRRGIGSNKMNQSFYQDGFIIPDVDYHLEPPPPKVMPMFHPSLKLAARLRAPEGWWEAYEDGHVDYLRDDGEIIGGGMKTPADRAAFGDRKVARLEPRKYARGKKHGYTIVSTDGATYVPSQQR